MAARRKREEHELPPTEAEIKRARALAARTSALFREAFEAEKADGDKVESEN